MDKTYRGLVYSKDLVHVLVDRQKQGIPLCQLIPILRLSREQRSLILAQPLLQLPNLHLQHRYFTLSDLQARLSVIQLLRHVDPRLSLSSELSSKISVLSMEFVNDAVSVTVFTVFIVKISTSAGEFIFETFNVTFESVDFELEGESGGCVRFAELLGLGFEILKCALDVGQITLTLSEKRLCASKVIKGRLQSRFFSFKSTLLAT